MDDKQRQHLEILHDRITRGAFDELDAKSFMLILREQGSEVLTEFGDFVAHRERDKGRMCKFANDLPRRVAQMHRTGPGLSEQENTRLQKGVFSCTEVYAAVNEALKKFGLAPFNAGRAALLLFVTLSATQGSSFLKGKQEFGTVSLILDAQNVELSVDVPSARVGGSGRLSFALIQMPNAYMVPRSKWKVYVPTTALMRVQDGRAAFYDVTGAELESLTHS